jgi:signal transduction histidine kinase
VVSANGKQEERLLGYEAGADDYITKPFNSEELLAKIQVFMKLRRTEEVDNIKNSLLELLSSEARDPVKQIIDCTGELIDDPQTPDHIWEFLSVLYRSAIDLSRFIGKADRLYRLRQQDITLHCSRGALAKHLSSIISQWTPAAKQKGLRVICDRQDNDDISMDWDILDEVLGFLLDNAVRYSEEGRDIVISVFQSRERCLIQFRNQGQVIDPKHHLNSIFAPFYVQDIEHHHKGHGLSLAIAKELISAFHGEISVHSGPEGITVFTLDIPLSPIVEPKL